MSTMIENALGRKVPVTVNGFAYEPYRGAFADLAPGPREPQPTPTRQGRGESRVAPSLAAVMEEFLPDQGGWISFPHYYREDTTLLRLVLEGLRASGRRGVKVMGIAFFNSHAELLLPALAEGLLAGIEGNTYGAVAKAVGEGRLLPWVGLGRTHGGRARAFQCGERSVDLAILPVPIADAWGNANGVMGRDGARCGPISLGEPDARWTRHTVLLTERIHPGLLLPNPIDSRWVDRVVQVERVGENRNIATGTTDIRRVKGDELRNRIAANVVKAMTASGVVREGCNFQVGSGAGLLVLRDLLEKMRREGIRGGFTVGGSMEFHVDLLQEGLVESFLDGQCFQPSARLFESLRTDPRHQEISTSFYYSPAAKQTAVGLLDVAVLGCNEIDLDFNVNTVTGYDGVLRAGIGGGPDAAAGAALTLFALPMARVSRKGLSCPCIRERVNTVVTPGEVVSAVVTEECIALNERNDSPWLPALGENARDQGLELVPMAELADRALAKAKALGTLMEAPRYEGQVVMALEWRDGRLIDVVRRLAR